MSNPTTARGTQKNKRSRKAGFTIFAGDNTGDNTGCVSGTTASDYGLPCRYCSFHQSCVYGHCKAIRLFAQKKRPARQLRGGHVGCNATNGGATPRCSFHDFRSRTNGPTSYSPLWLPRICATFCPTAQPSAVSRATHTTGMQRR